MNTNTNINYLAGFFDAEGTVQIYREKRRKSVNYQYILNVYVTNTFVPILEEYKKQFGGSIHNHPSSLKPCFRWQLTGKEARSFLETISPYLWEKKEQADLGIQLQKHKDDNRKLNWKLVTPESLKIRDNLYNRIKYLKHI